MKILNVSMSLDPISGGGTVERTIQLSRYLSKAGVECTILTSTLNINKAPLAGLAQAGVKLVALPCLNQRFHIPKIEWQTIKKLVYEADVVHLINHWTFINAFVYLFCKILKKPYVLCPAGALPIFGRSVYLKKIYNLFIGNRIVQDASAHIAIPEDEIEQFKAYAVSPDNITVIPNGIDRNDFADSDTETFRKNYNLPPNPFILFVGRLNLIKGPDLLLKAYSSVQRKYQNYHLVFIGPDDGMLASLESESARLMLQSKVHFLGYIGGEEKSRAYHAADIIVIPSRQEAMSIVVLEAGITGTPVLLTDACGFDQVEECGGGLVVTPTVQEIDTGLESMLQDSESLVRKGRSLQTFVLKHFSWDAIIKQYIHLFRSILP